MPFATRRIRLGRQISQPLSSMTRATEPPGLGQPNQASSRQPAQKQPARLDRESAIASPPFEALAHVGVPFPPLPFCLLEPVKTGTEEPDSGNSPAPEGAEQAPVEEPTMSSDDPREEVPLVEDDAPLVDEDTPVADGVSVIESGSADVRCLDRPPRRRTGTRRACQDDAFEGSRRG
jgi:hypothetical protein